MKFWVLFLFLVTVMSVRYVHRTQLGQISLRYDKSNAMWTSIKQLTRMGGNASKNIQLGYLNCESVGFNDIKWKCKSRLPPGCQLDKLHMICKHSDPSTIAEGSCYANYIINNVSDEVCLFVDVVATQNNQGEFLYNYNCYNYEEDELPSSLKAQLCVTAIMLFLTTSLIVYFCGLKMIILSLVVILVLDLLSFLLFGMY